MYLGMVVSKQPNNSIKLHMQGSLTELFKFYLEKRDIKESEKPAGASLFDINEESDVLSDANKKFFHSTVAG